MEINVSIVELGLPEIMDITPHVREMDKTESLLQTGKPVSESLIDSYLLSSSSWAGYANGELVTVFGVAAMAPMQGVGSPWLVGTPLIGTYARQFLRHGWHYLNDMKLWYGELSNYVYDENEVAKRWLQWMGFEMGDPEPFGPERASFRRFQWRREDQKRVA